MRHEFVEKLVGTFAGKVGAPAATLAAKVLGKDAYVSRPGASIGAQGRGQGQGRVEQDRQRVLARARHQPGLRALTKLKLELGIK